MSIAFSALACPSCGAPLPPEAVLSIVTCKFCGASVAAQEGMVSAAAFRRALADLEDPKSDVVRVANVPYRIFGRVAPGESTDVFLAERAWPLKERVLIKVLRAERDADLLEREWDVLRTLSASKAQGAAHFTQRLPQPVAKGTAEGAAGNATPALVLRAMSGFTHTFEGVRGAYPSGIDPRHAVWMWRRVLELCGFLHKSGYVHGAVLPQHLVVHARDHGVGLVGFSCAQRIDPNAHPIAVSARQREFYPAEVLDGAPIRPSTDIAMSARSLLFVLGGDIERGAAPSSVPESIAMLIARHAVPERAQTDDAWTLNDLLGAAAREAFGPPQFIPFHLPGW